MGVRQLKYRSFLLMAALPLLSSLTYPQILPFHYYNTRNGLPSNYISTIVQDSRGFIWFGTNDGLSMFDGRQFQNYTLRDGLSNQIINDIAEDRRLPGVVWVGTDDGLCRFERGRFSVVYGPPQHPQSEIGALYPDHSGRIWFSVHDTLFVFDAGISRPLPISLPVDGIGQIIETGDSLLWIGHAGGVLRYSLPTGIFSSFRSGPSAEHGKRSMCVDGAGNLWIHRLTDDQKHSTLLRVRDSAVIEQRTMLPHVGIPFLVDDRKGNLLTGNTWGIERIPIGDPRVVLSRFVTTANGLHENYIRSLLLDREGSLWVGGNSKGVARLSDWSTVRIPLENVESPYRGSVAAVDDHDGLWVVTDSDLKQLYRDGSGTWHVASHKFSPHPLSIAVDGKGYLWLALLDATLAQFRVISKAGGESSLVLVRRLVAGRDFPAGIPITFVVDDLGRVWESLGDKGVLLLDPARKRPLVKMLGPDDGVPSNYVRALLSDSKGRLWCGSYQEGLSFVSRNDAGISTTVAGLPDQKIRALLEDRQGRIWVGMRSGGLSVLSGASWSTVTVRDGLPSNTIWAMSEDTAGRVWLGTAVGAVRVDSLAPLRTYNKTELAGSPVFALGRFHSGMMWFISVDGVTVYDPTMDMMPVPPPGVYVTDVLVDGSSIDFSGEISLSHDRNTCTIEFVSPSFVYEDAVRYRYRMQPRDTAWQEPIVAPRVTYEFLSPGSYQFEVEAINGGGVFSTRPAVLAITVVPPWWESGWFVALAWLGCALAIAASVRALEIRALRRKMEALEREQALEKERLRIARDMHDEIGSTLSEITILSELARQPSSSPGKVEATVDVIAVKARQVLENIGEIIWATNPKNDEFGNLASYVRNYALRYCDNAGIQCVVEIPDSLPAARLSAEQRRNVFLIIKEGLHNVVKHARATTVTLRLAVVDSRFELEIRDNGKGFDVAHRGVAGTGLSNMKHRAEEIGGVLTVASKPGTGTVLAIYFISGIAQGKRNR
jgi:signal transduction histidine kinase/sugar lactone lactonase YvrE